MTNSCFDCKYMCNKGNRRFGCKLKPKNKSISFHESINTICEDYTQKLKMTDKTEEVVYYR